jgi:hypothetical protein
MGKNSASHHPIPSCDDVIPHHPMHRFVFVWAFSGERASQLYGRGGQPSTSSACVDAKKLQAGWAGGRAGGGGLRWGWVGGMRCAGEGLDTSRKDKGERKRANKLFVTYSKYVEQHIRLSWLDSGMERERETHTSLSQPWFQGEEKT